MSNSLLALAVIAWGSRTGTPSAVPFVTLHFASKNLVHICLVLLASPSKPVENVRIDAQAHQLFDGPIKTAHLNVGCSRPSLRCIGIVDLGVGSIGKRL